jgi:hypothetical protein
MVVPTTAIVPSGVVGDLSSHSRLCRCSHERSAPQETQMVVVCRPLVVTEKSLASLAGGGHEHSDVVL